MFIGWGVAETAPAAEAAPAVPAGQATGPCSSGGGDLAPRDLDAELNELLGEMSVDAQRAASDAAAPPSDSPVLASAVSAVAEPDTESVRRLEARVRALESRLDAVLDGFEAEVEARMRSAAMAAARAVRGALGVADVDG
jgi:hypothetical protein